MANDCSVNHQHPSFELVEWDSELAFSVKIVVGTGIPIGVASYVLKSRCIAFKRGRLENANEISCYSVI